MDFTFTEEQLLIKQAARDYAERELIKDVLERDAKAEIPWQHIKNLGELGFFGMMVDPKYGGGGMDTLSYVLAIEEISKIDLLSEPEAGSDATSQKTTAEDKGDYYLLNGTKNWISSAHSGAIYIVMAQTYPELGSRGINAFIVEKEWPGISLSPHEDKMGLRSSDTHSVMFTDCKVPKANRIGDDGFGFRFAMKLLEAGRISISAQATGIAGAAFDRALQYAQERKAFGKYLIDHQAIAFKLSDMYIRLEASRNFLYKAAWLKDNRQPYGLASSMSKLYCADSAMYITTEAVQILGGYGYVKEYHVERLMREAKVTQIYEGTSEIQKIVISRALRK